MRSSSGEARSPRPTTTAPLSCCANRSYAAYEMRRHRPPVHDRRTGHRSERVDEQAIASEVAQLELDGRYDAASEVFRPLADAFPQDYATQLRSLTQGRGVYTMQFARYERVPDKIAAEITRRYVGA